jgi:hypothetical protein
MRYVCGAVGRDSKGQSRSANPSDASTAAKEHKRLSEERSELWEPSVAGALEAVTVTATATTYNRAAGTLGVFIAVPLIRVYKRTATGENPPTATETSFKY